MKQVSISLIVFLALSIFIWLCVFKLYPKYNQSETNATIAWDVSGYYYYLPAIFIYKDLKHLGFIDSVMNKYKPVNYFNQAYKLENGNYVMQYTCGQAISFLPFFIVGHWVALSSSKYPADGFSIPYQYAIALSSFFFTLVGLWVSRKILLKFFSESVTAITLLVLVLGSNYLNYVILDGAMTHNFLYTLYAILILLTIRFYENPSQKGAIYIGIILGFLCLTRPSELISCLIPLLWGVNILSKKSIRDRFLFIRSNYRKLVIASIAVFLVGCIQLIYWKYVSGDWLVYSYRKEGFSWLKPHILDGLFSYKRGWLIYTPVMIFSIIGIYFMKRRELLKPLISTVLIFMLLFIYIAFAWDIWWYGGSVGQRTMVQSYAILILPLAAFFDYIKSRNLIKPLVGIAVLLFCYINFWWTAQYHFGRYFWAEPINANYFWNVLGKINFDENDLKLLDNDEGTIYDYNSSELLYTNNFEQDTAANLWGEMPIENQRSYCIYPEKSFTPELCFKHPNTNFHYIRSRATFKCIMKENNTLKSAQYKIIFKDHSQVIKENFVRLDRFYEEGVTKIFFFDTKTPNQAYDEICVQLTNGYGNNRFVIDEVKVEGLLVE